MYKVLTLTYIVGTLYAHSSRMYRYYDSCTKRTMYSYKVCTCTMYIVPCTSYMYMHVAAWYRESYMSVVYIVHTTHIVQGYMYMYREHVASSVRHNFMLHVTLLPLLHVTCAHVDFFPYAYAPDIMLRCTRMIHIYMSMFMFYVTSTMLHIYAVRCSHYMLHIYGELYAHDLHVTCSIVFSA